MLKQQYTVSGNDIYPNGTIKLSSLMKLMQQAAVSDIDQYGATYEELKQRDLFFVIVKFGIEFLKSISKNDTIVIQTNNSKTSAVRFYRDYVFLRGGEVVARASTQWVLMSLSRRMPVRASKFEFDIIKSGEEIIGIELPRKISAAPPYDTENLHLVRYSSLDENRHLNNSVYADLIVDYPPFLIEAPIKRCVIDFNGEAMLGDTLSIASKKTTNGYCVVCRNETTDKSCFDAIVEFDEAAAK